MKREKRLNKRVKTSIIVSAVTVFIVVALIITNFYIPVKYLFSYFVLRNKGAEEGVMRVRFLDVDYGDCIIVELPDGKNMLIDGGDGKTVHESKILKTLNKCDIKTIDYLFCSSFRREYCGGLEEIIKYKSVKNIYMPDIANTYVTNEYNKFVLAANASKAEVYLNRFGAGKEGGDYFFAVLNSGDSAVIWLEYAGAGFLFTSSAKRDVGAKIADGYLISKAFGESYCKVGNHFVNLENCKVLQLSNHGASDGAAIPLFELADPDYLVISVGKNGEGLPSMDALSLVLSQENKELFRTDEEGDITFSVYGDGTISKN